MAGLEEVVGHLRSERAVAAVLSSSAMSRRRVPAECLRAALGYVRRRAAARGDGERKVSLLESAAGLAMDLGDYGEAKALYAEELDILECLGSDEVAAEEVRYHCDLAEDYGRGVRLLEAGGDAVGAAQYARRHGLEAEAGRLFRQAIGDAEERGEYGEAAEVCVKAGDVGRARQLYEAGARQAEAECDEDLAETMQDGLDALETIVAAPEAARESAEATFDFELAAGICWYRQDRAAARAYLSLVDLPRWDELF